MIEWNTEYFILSPITNGRMLRSNGSHAYHQHTTHVYLWTCKPDFSKNRRQHYFLIGLFFAEEIKFTWPLTNHFIIIIIIIIIIICFFFLTVSSMPDIDETEECCNDSQS